MNKGNDHAQVKIGASEAKPQAPKSGNSAGGPSSGARPYPSESTFPEPIVNCDMGRES
ncbi:MAG TPA: hypothetical protein VGZ22_29530 [Isosphaeraceae bacterium]|jgi:hypothetical protein|nr:hypothetical protein [Isosphaeraceae bacterium]